MVLFEILRPDALVALQDAGVKKALSRYVKVVQEKLPPNFQIAKMVEAEFDESFDEERLWKLHSRSLKKFYSLREKIDQEKTKLEELEKPKKSLLDLKAVLAEKLLSRCCFCARRCGVNRRKGEKGFCRSGVEWKIFGAHAHYGEEAELVPSGTIFQAACSLKCLYCQNAPDSFTPELGEEWSIAEVVDWVEKMQGKVRNINWVGGDPTPWLWHILKALKLCEVRLAQVWNSNAYYSEETAELLQGIVDVYLLDFRYFNEKCATKLSSAPRYPEVAQRNHLKAKQDAELLIRLLVMPGHLECDAKPILKWIRENLGEQTRVNILAQYRPCWKAWQFEELSKPLSRREWLEIVEYAKQIGLKNFVRE